MDLCFLFLVNIQRIVRLEKWYSPYPYNERKCFLDEIISLVFKKKETDCPVLEYKGFRIVYRRYASLYFIAGTPLNNANEVMISELIHRYVELLDLYFENVCELDILFKFQKAYYILDELVIGGMIKDTAIEHVLKEVVECDLFEEESKKNSK